MKGVQKCNVLQKLIYIYNTRSDEDLFSVRHDNNIMLCVQIIPLNPQRPTANIRLITWVWLLHVINGVTGGRGFQEGKEMKPTWEPHICSCCFKTTAIFITLL